MRKQFVLALVFSGAIAAIPVYAHGRPESKAQDEKRFALTSVSGTVGRGTDRRSVVDEKFVDDKDGKEWIVDNPEFLKEHVGMHVVLTCRVSADERRLHVVEVKSLPR
jgi:hypothetical protein